MSNEVSFNSIAGCAKNEFRCSSSRECIDQSKVCDGVSDCPNEEDELLPKCSTYIFRELTLHKTMSTHTTLMQNRCKSVLRTLSTRSEWLSKRVNCLTCYSDIGAQRHTSYGRIRSYFIYCNHGYSLSCQLSNSKFDCAVVFNQCHLDVLSPLTASSLANIMALINVDLLILLHIMLFITFRLLIILQNYSETSRNGHLQVTATY